GENVPPDRTSAVRDGLVAGADYCFKVRVQVGGQWSALSAAGCVPPVPPPTNVAASMLSTTSARVSWNNPAGAIEAIQIYQSRDGGSYVFGENVPPDRNDAIRDGLATGASYCFKVRVQMAGRWSALSASEGCVTLNPPPVLPPPPPTGVSAEAISSTSARIRWNNPSVVIHAIQIDQIREGGGWEFGENVPPDRQEAIRDGLAAGANYCFRVRVQRDGVWSVWSEPGCYGPVPPPSGVTATQISATSARVSWNNPAGTIEAIQIYQSRNGGPYELGENVPPDRTSAERTGLSTGDQYCFKVRVQIAGRWSAFSDALCITLNPPPQPPPPTGVSAEATSSTSARIQWNNPPVVIHAIQIEQMREGSGWEVGENVPADRQEAIRDGLAAGASYCFRVRIQRDGVWSVWSDPGCYGPVPPPTGVTASQITSTSARVSWNNPAGTIEAIQIYQSRNGGPYEFGENVPPDRTSAERTGLSTGDQYCFKVRVQIAGRWSALSASEGCVTLNPPLPPTGVTAVAVSSTSVRISWNNPAGTIEAIEIHQSRDGSSYVFGENVPPDRSSAVRDGLVAGAEYCFKVRVQMGGAWSPFSAPGCLPPIPPPTNVAASRLSATSARVSWTNPAGTIEVIQIYQSRDRGSYVFGENVPPDRNNAVRDGLAAGAEYCFKVRVQMMGRWSALSSDEGCVTFGLTSNDNFADRLVLSGVMGSTTGGNQNATKETGEPNHAGDQGGKSVWWQWTAPGSGTATIDTFGSGFDTLLGVYTGASVSSLTPVAANDDDNGGLQSRVSFLAAAGTSYKIAVDGFGGSSGAIVLNWNVAPPAVPDIRIDPLTLTFDEPSGGAAQPKPTFEPEGAGHETSAPAASTSVTLPQDKLIDPKQIMQSFTEAETVRVVVNLTPPLNGQAAVDFKSAASLKPWRTAIRAHQDKVIADVARGAVRVRLRYQNISAFSADVTWEALQALMEDPRVASIEPAYILEAHLNQGIPLMNAAATRPTYNGAGLAIAICDTGVDYNHPRLGGGGFPNQKVIGGYDFGEVDADPIPVGEAHGTACAGIAAGDLGTVGDYIGGVAPGARIYPEDIVGWLRVGHDGRDGWCLGLVRDPPE
ncbi:MAG: fibronectin type III domain-containing protein, partial [Verrucomicrobiales bacterium]|nr:fibronectin type III domain-containing protein [Verrucomicrobiales bacterium]